MGPVEFGIPEIDFIKQQCCHFVGVAFIAPAGFVGKLVTYGRSALVAVKVDGQSRIFFLPFDSNERRRLVNVVENDALVIIRLGRDRRLSQSVLPSPGAHVQIQVARAVASGDDQALERLIMAHKIVIDVVAIGQTDSPAIAQLGATGCVYMAGAAIGQLVN